jgi:hypothetical protein
MKRSLYACLFVTLLVLLLNGCATTANHPYLEGLAAARSDSITAPGGQSGDEFQLPDFA